nr:SDR family oxidoreductase [Rhodoglobus vestalii]
MGRLSGKVAIVTGAASGIGNQTARDFAEAGAKVIAVDLNDGALANAFPDSSDYSETILAISFDVTDSIAVEEFFDSVEKNFGRVDVLVNCAGIGIGGSIIETSDEVWDRVINVNLRSVFLMCRAAVRMMVKEGAGRIINMGSAAGVIGVKDQSAYCASKGGVVLLSKQMAVDFEHLGIRVNAVCPIGVNTPLLTNQLEPLVDPSQTETELKKKFGTVLPVQEVSAVILFLATDGLSSMPVPYIQ